MEMLELTKILKDLRKGLEQILGERLVEVYLYGSRARGDERLDSKGSFENQLIPIMMNVRREAVPI